MTTAHPKQYIRQSQELCSGEQQYVQDRKHVVLEAFNKLGINCTLECVPHVALLASGGGQRAAVSLLGSVSRMAAEDLLDTMLYLGGVSGSTWSMASLYSDPMWSKDIMRTVAGMQGSGVELSEVVFWLEQRAKEEHFSLTDIWAVITAAGIMKQMDVRCLSEEASRNATNPYPVYSAIEKYCFSQGLTNGSWFELTPHEAGFTELGLFVETSQLGSSFLAGELKQSKPEMDMVKLQGILGSAVADEAVLKGLLPPWMTALGHDDGIAYEYMRVYHIVGKLVAMMRNRMQDPVILTNLDDLQEALKAKVNYNDSAVLKSKSPQEKKELFQNRTFELIRILEVWCQGLPDGPFKIYVSWLVKHVIPLIVKWEWGTVGNYLYQHPDPAVPCCLHSKERINLMDAGLLVNVGYPPFLGDKRDIDLIIAPEYSAGDIFETLTLARDYAEKVNKPFPEIDNKILEEKDWPKDCYVFQGEQNQPTIIYMPLFNRKNCKDAEEVKARMEEFSTFQKSFNQGEMEFLMETAGTNIKNNRDTILTELERAVQRRQDKTNS